MNPTVEERRLVTTTGLTSCEPFPPGATLSLLQRETGAWEPLIDETAFHVVADAIDHGDGAPVWVTLYVEEVNELGRPVTYTRFVGHVTAATSGSDGPSFHFGNGEKIPAVHIAGVHL